MVAVALILMVILTWSLYNLHKASQRLVSLEAQAQRDKIISDVMSESLENTDNELTELKSLMKKTVSQKKSSEVRTGLIVEQMAPFLAEFPRHPKDSVFLGKPIDFVAFDDDGVHFIEVKSGKSQLNTNQRKIRDHIKEGRVTFEIYKIEGNG